MDNRSLLQKFKERPIEEQREILSRMSVNERVRFFNDWKFIGRENQKNPPGDWHTWLILAGRGFG